MVVYLHEALETGIHRGSPITEQDLWEAIALGGMIASRFTS